jgi:hypothetical protein
MVPQSVEKLGKLEKHSLSLYTMTKGSKFLETGSIQRTCRGYQIHTLALSRIPGLFLPKVHLHNIRDVMWMLRIEGRCDVICGMQKFNNVNKSDKLIMRLLT